VLFFSGGLMPYGGRRGANDGSHSKWDALENSGRYRPASNLGSASSRTTSKLQIFANTARNAGFQLQSECLQEIVGSPKTMFSNYLSACVFRDLSGRNAEDTNSYQHQELASTEEKNLVIGWKA
jgi:hypothetical protein